METTIPIQDTYTSEEDELIITEVIRQLDEVDWKLGAEDGERKAYWSAELGDSPVIGFRRISYITGGDIEEMAKFHGEGIADVWAYLSKDTYSHGEYLAEYHKSKDTYHGLVRTMFDLPYGMASREYLHYLYRKRVDENTICVVFRTPKDVSQMPPPKNKHTRCIIYNSGDRFQLQPDGRIKVEHLMTYTLEGGVTHWMADNLFKKAHIDAYFSEAKYINEIFDNTASHIPNSYPSQFNMYVSLERLNVDKLLSGLQQLLKDEAVKWESIKKDKTVSITIADMPYSPFKGYKGEATLNVSAKKAADYLSNNFIKNLPKWCLNLKKGEVLEILPKDGNRESWIIRTVHQGAFPFKDREYTALLVRTTLENGQEIIAMQSVLKFDLPVTKKCVRGNLYPSVTCITPIADNKSKIEQISVAEFNGRVTRKMQNGKSSTTKYAKDQFSNLKQLQRIIK